MGAISHLLLVSGLDVHDDVAHRQRLPHGVLDVVRRRVTLPDRRSGGNADHDVGELSAARLPHAQPAQLDALDAVDRSASRVLDVVRHGVHQHVDVAPHETHGRRDHEQRDEERSNRVGLGVAGVGEQEPDEHGGRAGEVTPEVERVRLERSAVVPPGCAKREGRATRVDDDHDEQDRERPPGDLEVGRIGEAEDGRDPDADAEQREDRRLGQRGEVLSFAVAVGVVPVGGADRDPDREERKERRDEVGAGVQRLGEEPEAPGRDPGHELQDEEARGGEHGHERDSALRGHTRKHDGLPELRAGEPGRRAVLLRLRDADRGGTAGARGAQGRDRALLRPRRLDGAGRAARSRGRARAALPLPRAGQDRAGALRRHGREVHRRRCDGAVRRAGGARGRPGTGRPLRARDPRLGAGSRRASGPNRHHHGRGARRADRAATGRGGDGVRRRRQHRGAASEQCTREWCTRRRDDVPRDAEFDRVRRRPRRRGQGQEARGQGVGGHPGEVQVRDRRPSGRPSRSRRARDGARPHRPHARTSPSRARAATRHPRWGARHRQEPPRVRALSPHRRGT